jgi:hypothetical protein
MQIDEVFYSIFKICFKINLNFTFLNRCIYIYEPKRLVPNIDCYSC